MNESFSKSFGSTINKKKQFKVFTIEAYLCKTIKNCHLKGYSKSYILVKTKKNIFVSDKMPQKCSKFKRMRHNMCLNQFKNINMQSIGTKRASHQKFFMKSLNVTIDMRIISIITEFFHFWYINADIFSIKSPDTLLHAICLFLYSLCN